MNIKTILICAMLIACHRAGIAQTVSVTGEGTWEISSDVTPRVARARAMDRAMADALENAGISTLFTGVTTSVATDNAFSFGNYTSAEIMGEFLDIKTVVDEPFLDKDRMFCKVVINARIRKGKPAGDSGFDASVSGIAKTYMENDQVTFTFNPTMDCFLQIFWFDDGGRGGMLYPNAREEASIFKAKTGYDFPLNPQIKYTLKKDTDSPVESNRYVFVITKDPRPYTRLRHHGATTWDELFNWFIKIPSDRRRMLTEPITIGQR